MDQKLIPTKKQVDFLNWEMGVFFHFGLRTFHPGHKDWDGKPMDLNHFNPTDLDCDEWIRTVKDAGATYTILTCKHHDGFANWPSAYTDYSVANTPWKNGKGDVVREYTDACRKHGIKIGLYYSPSDFSSRFGNRSEQKHNDFFIDQISELLTNYGKIDYLWFDGNGSAGFQYDKPRIIKAIRAMQPEILIFNMWDPDTAWALNEEGYAPYDNDNIRAAEGTPEMEPRFMPLECDFMIRYKSWFTAENDEDTVKSPELLMDLYDASVGRGANFLVNIGPDRTGHLPPKDKKSFIAFGNMLKKRFADPLIPAEVEENGDTYTLKFEKPVWVNTAVLEETIEEGQVIQEFEILAKLSVSGYAHVQIHMGKTVGHKTICKFPAVCTTELTVKVLQKKEEKSSYLKKATFYNCK